MKASLLISAASLIVLAFSAVLADPARPYGYDCLKTITQWEQVQGRWSIERGVMTHEPLQADKIAIFADRGIELPPWYHVSVSATGLSSAQEPYVGIIVGYRDRSNYCLCSVTREERGGGRVEISRKANNLSDTIVQAYTKELLGDTVRMSVEFYSEGDMPKITVAVDGNHVISVQLRGTVPNRFGLCLKSSAVSVTSCTIAGESKR